MLVAILAGHTTSGEGGQGRHRRVCAATTPFRSRWLKQTTAQATSTNANHRPLARSHRIQAAASSSTRTATAPPSSDAAQAAPTTPPPAGRSAAGSHADPGRRGWPRCRRPCQRGPRRSSAPLPRWRADRRDVIHDRLEHGGVVDVGGSDHGGQRKPTAVADQVDLASRLATIDRICAHMVPRAWRARWPSPRSPVTSPADPPHQAGPRP
jgi:hypothetical protein